jgi:impB/mucB/samB family
MLDFKARKIIHVDMDAFYASAEQRDDPSLKGRPVAVGYAAKRGVVAAASYEAREFGVRSAMPATTALRQCPDLVFVPPRFDVYRAVSHQIRAIFAHYTALIEPLSLDEAYLDVSENLRGLPTAWATAKEVRGRIFDETGLTASAGISYNKFLAKLASDYRKPNGQFAITRPPSSRLCPWQSSTAWGRSPPPRCSALGSPRAPTYAKSRSPSCSSILENPLDGIRPSREARMIAPSSPIASKIVGLRNNFRPRSHRASRHRSRRAGHGG